MLYILLYNYTPNNAAANRILAYLRSFDRMGVEATVVFFMPDAHKSKIHDKFSCITIEYCWDRFYFEHKWLKPVSFYCYKKQIRKRITAGDTIYTYGIDGLTKFATSIPEIKVFAERTEHPKASNGMISRLIFIDKLERRKVLKKLSGLFVISEPLRDYYVGEGIEPEKVIIVNMIVDPNRFYGLETNKSERYIAYCGTAKNNKDGVDELIKAYSIVAKQYPYIKLYIIGNSPSRDDEAGNLQLVEELNIRDRVVFTGLVKAEDMPQLLKKAEILALDRPDSLQAKCGFPTKLGEYLLTENPVVVTRVGDIPKFLKDGESALIAEQRNPQEFADKIIWCLEHPHEAQEIGRRGAAVAMKEFNCEIEAKKIIDFMSK